MKFELDHLYQSLTFLSRYPLDKFGIESSSTDFSTCSYTFPLAGIVIALPCSLLFLFLYLLGVNILVAATLVWLCMIISTGALHEDGLADTIDGLLGGKTKDEKLKIMKESTIGVYGTLSLIFSVTLRILCLWQFTISYGIFAGIVSFLCISALSRASMLWSWSRTQETDERSLAHIYGKPDDDDLLSTGIICLPILLFFFFTILFSGTFIPVIISCLFGACVVFAIGKLYEIHIETIRGDNLGAVQQCCEVSMYLGLIAFL